MRFRQRQAGEGIAGCALWAVILGIAVLIVIKIVPVKVQSAELKDFMLEQAKFAGRRANADRIKKAILDKADELGLPVTKEDVSVRLSGGRIRMRCTYVVPVDLVVHTYMWKFDHQVDRPIFII